MILLSLENVWFFRRFYVFPVLPGRPVQSTCLVVECCSAGTGLTTRALGGLAEVTTCLLSSASTVHMATLLCLCYHVHHVHCVPRAIKCSFSRGNPGSGLLRPSLVTLPVTMIKQFKGGRVYSALQLEEIQSIGTKAYIAGV